MNPTSSELHQLPVSVQICTLNEEANIRECLDYIQENNPAEIVVIDGGSSDSTVAIARQCGVTVIEAGRIGLARQRRAGYQSTRQPYVAFADADDRIPETWLQEMYECATSGNYSALQSMLTAFAPNNFWERGWDNYLRASIQPKTDTVMVGRPSIYLRRDLLNLPEPSDNHMEDTEMSMLFSQMGLRQGIATTTAERICDDTARSNMKKWKAYGRGYKILVQQFPDRKRSILFHILWQIPIKRSLLGLKRGNLLQPIFQMAMSGTILLGFCSRDHIST